MPANGVYGRGQRPKVAFAARKTMGAGFLMSLANGSDQLPFNQTRSSSSATVGGEAGLLSGGTVRPCRGRSAPRVVWAGLDRRRALGALPRGQSFLRRQVVFAGVEHFLMFTPGRGSSAGDVLVPERLGNGVSLWLLVASPLLEIEKVF